MFDGHKQQTCFLYLMVELRWSKTEHMEIVNEFYPQVQEINKLHLMNKP